MTTDPSEGSRRRVPALIPYAALACGQVTPDDAVELAERITGQSVRVGGRRIGRVLAAVADLDGVRATLEMEPGIIDSILFTAGAGTPGGLKFGDK